MGKPVKSLLWTWTGKCETCKKDLIHLCGEGWVCLNPKCKSKARKQAFANARTRGKI